MATGSANAFTVPGGVSLSVPQPGAANAITTPAGIALYMPQPINGDAYTTPASMGLYGTDAVGFVQEASKVSPTVQGFKQQFVEFVLTPDNTVQLWIDTALDYISPLNYGIMQGGKRLYAIYLMTAHLLKIAMGIESGTPLQLMNSATEGSVSVGLVPPPINQGNGFQWWLCSTPYGSQLWAFLSVKSVGGWYAGGAYVRTGIRNTNGYFGLN